MATQFEIVSDVDEEKRQARLEQLSAVDAERQAERDKRKKEQSEKADPLENIKAFLSSWDADRQAVRVRLNSFASGGQAVDEAGRRQIKAAADDITSRLFELQRSVAAASYFLPAFEIRNLSAIASELRNELESARATRLPRVPFQFSDPNVIVVVDDPLKQGLTTRERLAESASSQDHAAALAASTSYTDPETTLSNMTGARIIRCAQDLRGKDWMLANLTDCTVLLHGPIQALYLHNLRNCHLEAGPVSGGTLGEGIESCTLMVATHQLRLHHTQHTDVYVRPGSDPIIEHCSNVRFGPLDPLPYGGYGAALDTARIARNSAQWRQVQDFQFPGHVQSPNWSVIPDAERKGALRVDAA